MFNDCFLTVNEILFSPDPYCAICSKKFASYPAYNFHKVKSHSVIEKSSDERLFHKLTKSQKNSQPVVSRYFCPVDVCKYNFDAFAKISELNKDDRVLNRKRPKLLYFSNGRQLKQHFLKVHSEKKFTCSVCGVRKFSLERDRRFHEKCCKKLNSGNEVASGAVEDKVIFPIVINGPVFIQMPLVFPVLNVISSKTSIVPIAPKPNSIVRCFVEKYDASVQTMPYNKPRKPSNRKKKFVAATQTEDRPIAPQIAPKFQANFSDFCDLLPSRKNSASNSSSTNSLHLYDETACQTAVVQTLTAGVQSVVAQSDIFCQTNESPMMADASVTTDILECINWHGNFEPADRNIRVGNRTGYGLRAPAHQNVNGFVEPTHQNMVGLVVEPTYHNVHGLGEPSDRNVHGMIDHLDNRRNQQQIDEGLPVQFLLSNFDENSTWSNIETQTDRWPDDVMMTSFDYDDSWRHIETQTSIIDFIDSFQSAGTQTQTDFK